MKKIILSLLVLTSVSSFGQSEYDKLVEEGLQFLKQRNISAAIEKYEAAYKIDSTKVEANYGLGVAYVHYCQNKEQNCFTALYYLNRAIKINDQYRNCYYNRGSVKNTVKDYNGALKDFNNAIAKNNKKAHYYFNRSLTHRNMGNYQQECNDLKKAAQLGSSNAKKVLPHRKCN